MKNTSNSQRTSFIDSNQQDKNNDAIEQAFHYVASESGQIDNMYKAMALSPNIIKPIHDLYLAIAHDDDCPLAHWEIELLSVQVAILNDCSYALAHHGMNLHNFINDRNKSDHLIATLTAGNWATVLEDNKLIAMLDYGKKLCLHPEQVTENDINVLRSNGLNEKEIVFLAQITSAYAYWTRILNALGVEVGDEPIGLPISKIRIKN